MCVKGAGGWGLLSNFLSSSVELLLIFLTGTCSFSIPWQHLVSRELVWRMRSDLKPWVYPLQCPLVFPSITDLKARGVTQLKSTCLACEALGSISATGVEGDLLPVLKEVDRPASAAGSWFS